MIMTTGPYGKNVLPLINNSIVFCGNGKTTIKLSDEE